MSYSMLDYWPPFLQGQPGEKTFHFPFVDSSAPAFSMQFFWDAATFSMILRQTNADGSWNSDWFLRWTSNGLVEWRDDTPAAGWAKLFGPKSNVTMNPPIWWGKDLNIGTPVAASCKQTGLFGKWGYQVVAAEAHHESWNGATFCRLSRSRNGMAGRSSAGAAGSQEASAPLGISGLVSPTMFSAQSKSPK